MNKQSSSQNKSGAKQVLEKNQSRFSYGITETLPRGEGPPKVSVWIRGGLVREAAKRLGMLKVLSSEESKIERPQWSMAVVASYCGDVLWTGQSWEIELNMGQS